MNTLIKLIAKLHMWVVMRLTHDKTHYLNAPDSLLPSNKVHSSLMIRHFFPSVILSVVIVVKLLPRISEFYKNELSKNSSAIPLTMIPVFMLCLIAFGIITEGDFARKYNAYADYKRTLRDTMSS